MITLRPAQPTAEDARAFASLYAMATLNMMNRYLGPQAYHILARLFLLSRHEHSYDVTTFAEQDGVPVGLLMGYSSTAHDAMSRRTLLLYVRYGLAGLLRSLPTIRQLRPLRDATGALPANAYYVKGLAVDPRYRRQEIGHQLLAYAETQARQAGCTRIVLDVRTHNAPAIALYQACGYQTTAETPSLHVSGETFAFYRMEKGL